MNTLSPWLGWPLLVAIGCGANAVKPNTPGASNVELSESTAPTGYVELGKLSVQSGKGCGFTGSAGSRQDADAQLRAEAAKLGATFVQITDVQAPRPNHQCLEHEYKLQGTAYRKQPAPPPTPPAPPPSASALPPTAAPTSASSTAPQPEQPREPEPTPSQTPTPSP